MDGAGNLLVSRSHPCPRVGITLSWTDLSILTDGDSSWPHPPSPGQNRVLWVCCELLWVFRRRVFRARFCCEFCCEFLTTLGWSSGSLLRHRRPGPRV